MLRRLRVFTANILLSVALIGSVELGYSALAWIFFSPADVWLFEDVGRTVRFDAVRGYELTPVPSRFARVAKGSVEYVGQFRGNAQGMPDRDDFIPERRSGASRRFAVLGDSYTSAQYIATNWPDRVEDILDQVGLDVELLNFSTHGGGLANWTSNIHGILQQQAYQLDGLIFAVHADDLERTFTVADGRNRSRFAMGRVSSWRPADYPRTPGEAEELLKRSEINAAYILSRAEFDAALSGRWQPERFWEFKATNAVAFQARRLTRRLRHAVKRLVLASNFNRAQLRLIDDIDRYAASADMPIWVVDVPGLDQAAGEPGPWQKHIKEFALRLNAELIDGRQAFAGVRPDELRRFWFRVDRHWNQAGSDRFAHYMARHLLRPAAAL